MSAYARNKVSKENAEVYTTDETYTKLEVVDASRKATGMLTALNDTLAIYMSGTVTSSSFPSGAVGMMSVTMSGDRKNELFTNGAFKGVTRVLTTIDQGTDEPDDINALVQFANLEANGDDIDMVFHLKNLDAVEKVIKFKFIVLQMR